MPAVLEIDPQRVGQISGMWLDAQPLKAQRIVYHEDLLALLNLDRRPFLVGHVVQPNSSNTSAGA